MTKDKRAKSDARTRMLATGERYTVARRNTAARAVSTRLFELDCCANCMQPLPASVEGLFCSELCSQTADTIRYWRRVSRDGRIDDPDVNLALRTRVAHLLAGGYRRRARQLSHAVRTQVWARDAGRCVQCAEPGAEVDHISGDSAELSNLQLLCLACHHAKTARQMTPASPEQQGWINELIAERVAPKLPALLCDDEVRWATEWRSLKSARRARLLDQLADMGYDRSDFPGRSWAEMWDEVFDIDADAYDEGGYTEDDDSGYGPYSYFAHAMAKDD
jgi:hypothetical protein